MATDFAFASWYLPVVVCVAVLVAIALQGRRLQVGPSSFLGVGRSRLAQGYLAALIATFLLCVVWAARIEEEALERWLFSGM